MLARVRAWVVDINLPGYTHVFQLGKDGSRLPNQNRLNSRFLHERASRGQSSLIGSICQYNAHWMRKCACMEPSNMRTKGLNLFLYHSSPRAGACPPRAGASPSRAGAGRTGVAIAPPHQGRGQAPPLLYTGLAVVLTPLSWCLCLQALCLS